MDQAGDEGDDEEHHHRLTVYQGADGDAEAVLVGIRRGPVTVIAMLIVSGVSGGVFIVVVLVAVIIAVIVIV